MNVLSLFDGMSCGQIALKELNIIPEHYYASEIDKFAIAQTKLNFPNTIHIGSVVNVNVSDLEPIDLLIGGSPCQSFSFAGKRKGMATKSEIQITKLEQYLELKSEGFEFEGQSYLFWEYMRILTDIRKYNPGVLFLLENVEMGKKWERILSESIGIFGVHINSALVSAQNRKRIYWTNIKTRAVGMFGELYSDIPLPTDRGILLRDILETEVHRKYFYSEKGLSWIKRHGEIKNKTLTVFTGNEKFPCLEATMAKKYSAQRFWGVLQIGGLRYVTPTECARLQTVPSWYKWKFVELNYFGYICSTTKKTRICKVNVTPLAVAGPFQISQRDYATCTTLGLLELEKQRVEKLTKQKSVKLMAAIEKLKQNNTETYVSCITKDFVGADRGSFQSSSILKNVSFVINKLGVEELTECVPVTIEVSNSMEILLTLKKESQIRSNLLNQQDITGVKIKDKDTKMSWSVSWGENLIKERLYTILTLINWIIDLKIYTYAKDALNIQVFIGNLSVSEQNYTSVELSDLRMESIVSCSDTQQYKMLGNGWTVEIIKWIFSFLPK